MERRDLKKLAAVLKKKAETETHKRLKVILNEFARSEGYHRLYKFPRYSPDVSRFMTIDGERYIFVGDAKRTQSETPGTSDTERKLRNYFLRFAALLRSGEINGGRIALATDKKQTALQWCSFLNRVTAECGLRGVDGARPRFKLIGVDQSTFIIYW